MAFLQIESRVHAMHRVQLRILSRKSCGYADCAKKFKLVQTQLKMQLGGCFEKVSEGCRWHFFKSNRAYTLDVYIFF